MPNPTATTEQPARQNDAAPASAKSAATASAVREAGAEAPRRPAEQDSQNESGKDGPGENGDAKDAHPDRFAGIPTVDEHGNTLSKSARKKLLKKQRMAETRAEWKAMKREKEKAAKARKREERAAAAGDGGGGVAAGEPGRDGDGGATRKRKAGDTEAETEAGQTAQTAAKKQKKREKREKKPVLHPITLILDCAFDELMTEREIVSMAAQLTRCYSANKNSAHQFSIAVTSLNGRLGARMDSIYADQLASWKNITFSAEPYTVPSAPPSSADPSAASSSSAPPATTTTTTTAAAASNNTEAPATPDPSNGAPSNLIYLTADSAYTITTLEPGCSYIIGGIVDRNRHKNLCYNKAVAQGLRTAKLPIGEYLHMSSRHVLTTNQVVEIMVRWLETRDWKRAFESVVPQRKMWKAKGQAGEGEAEGGGEGEEEGEQGEQNGGGEEKARDDNQLENEMRR